MKKTKSIKGLFGQIIHYEDGRYAGESWLGLFKESFEHYDATGKYAGYSDPGIIADLIHHDEYGGYTGKHIPVCLEKRSITAQSVDMSVKRGKV